MNLARNHPVTFKAFKGARQHLLRDTVDMPFQFVETARMLAKGDHNLNAPLVTYSAEYFAYAATAAGISRFGGHIDGTCS